MKTKLPASYIRALTLFEVLVTMAVIFLILLVVLSQLAKSRAKAPKMTCVNNLKQIGLSFRMFATDHEGKFPMQVSTNEGGSLEYIGTGETWRHFLTLSNELGIPKILTCPTDDKRGATNFATAFNGNHYVSYFIGLDTTEETPDMFLAGDRNLTINGQENSGNIEITAAMSLGWSQSMHGGSGNVVLGDGSVQMTSNESLNEWMSQSKVLTNRVSIPD